MKKLNLTILLLSILLSFEGISQSKKPNILVIWGDDLAPGISATTTVV
jgi:hypothetical protein